MKNKSINDVPTNDYGEFTERLCVAFLSHNYDFSFMAGEVYGRTQNEGLLNFLFNFVPTSPAKIIIDGTILTMPDFLVQQENGSLIEDFGDMFWIENKSFKDFRRKVYMPMNRFYEYLNVDYGSGFNVAVTFVTPIERQDFDNVFFYDWKYDIHIAKISEMNIVKEDRAEWGENYFWSLSSRIFKKLNNRPIKARDYREYFVE